MRRTVALLVSGALALGACSGSADERPEAARPVYRVEPACPPGPHHVAGLTVES